MTRQAKPAHRPGDLVLRIRGHQTSQSAHLVCLAEDRHLFAFTGLWASWRGVRGPKSAPVEGPHELFSFLTTEANAIVAPIHPKAMPVILTTPAELAQWLKGDTVEALKLQRPLPDEALRIVAKGERQDSNPNSAP
jgi:putative SOS response-associated peptidase YedK